MPLKVVRLYGSCWELDLRRAASPHGSSAAATTMRPGPYAKGSKRRSLPEVGLSRSLTRSLSTTDALQRDHTAVRGFDLDASVLIARFLANREYEITF